MKIEAMVCGYLESDASALMAQETGRLRIPVPTFLIEHPKGRVVFDTGLHRELQTSGDRLGTLAELSTVDFKPGDELAARLTMHDVAPDQIDYVINSHLHFDHVGGNAVLRNAKMIVQRREWEAAKEPALSGWPPDAFNRADFDLGHPLQLIDGEHDLFGDGRVVCVPTYGHTAGHQSLRVRLDNREVMLTADSCYMRRTLENMIMPPFAHDFDAMRQVLSRFRAMERAGTHLIFGHDLAQWKADGTLAAPFLTSPSRKGY